MSESSWRERHRIVTGFLWAEVPALLVVGLLGPRGLVETLILLLVVVACGLGARFMPGHGSRERFAGFGLIAGSFIGIELSGGQVHAHLFILSAIALVALYQSWAPLLLTVGAVVVHHLTLGLAAPERVFNLSMDGSAHATHLTFAMVITMVATHAVAVLVEVAGILLLWRFAEAAEHETEELRHERDAEHLATQQAQRAAAESEREAEQLRLVTLAQTRDDVSRHAQSIRGQVEDAASAVTQLEDQAQVLRRAVADVADRCQQAAATAGTGEQTATTAAEEVRRLERAMGEISEVNQMIAQLAGQTNLLSLNATIEAARAGEMGKGFAVVAQEVKVLANETAASAEKVRGVIEGVVEETEKVARSFATTSALVADIHRAQIEIANSVEEQASVLDGVAQQTSTVTTATRSISQGLRELEDVVSRS